MTVTVKHSSALSPSHTLVIFSAEMRVNRAENTSVTQSLYTSVMRGKLKLCVCVRMCGQHIVSCLRDVSPRADGT